MMEYMIGIIKQHWFYEDGELESMPESEIRDIYEALLDWIEE